MSTAIRPLRPPRPIHQFLQQTQRRHASSDFSHLTKRRISPVFSTLSPDSSYRLQTTLADFLPHPPPLTLPSSLQLPPAHHLLYFEPTKLSSELLPDGTNPDHFPGEPFVRRMWAGGKVLWNHHEEPLTLDGGVGVCAEFIRDVKERDDKVFVEIERRIATASPEELEALQDAWRDASVKQDLEHRVRQRLWRDAKEDFGVARILESRILVFRLLSRDTHTSSSSSKILNPSIDTPDFTHAFLPTPTLLFRFSALTFNAHAIHLDPAYAETVEGYRNLLVQGPLSLTCMLTLLSRHLEATTKGNEVIRSIEYRNTAPLYCGEEAKFCGKRSGEKKWEVWAQGPGGGVCVKGRVRTGERR
ncbi:hypothetical protein AC578_1546 [Pseudocercospora eumusae]|uniref:MaoC-like domain-containing protein n=1 Tax=Pseudocercospora eumusae TaxID=321146 RepID=A0A139HLV0_9PEZI|nr:hypothetical protein AC578_1546 [Pseudocercospora eumusae]